MRLTKYSGVAKSEIAQPPVMAPLLEPRKPQAQKHSTGSPLGNLPKGVVV